MAEIGDEGGTTPVSCVPEIGSWRAFLEETREELALLKADYHKARAREQARLAELERQAELDAVFRPRWFWRLWARLGLP